MAHRVTAALVPLPLVCTLIPAATAHASMRMRAMTTDCCMSAHACQSRDAVGRAAQTSAALKGAETHGRPQRYYWRAAHNTSRQMHDAHARGDAQREAIAAADIPRVTRQPHLLTNTFPPTRNCV